MSILGSVTENEEFNDQGKEPMETVTRRKCFTDSAATITNDPLLVLLSVEHGEHVEPIERPPPPILQAQAKISSTTELDNIRAVNRRNIRLESTGGKEDGESPKSLIDRPKKRSLYERLPRAKPNIAIDTSSDPEVNCCGCNTETTKDIYFSPKNGGVTQYMCKPCYESMQTGPPRVIRQDAKAIISDSEGELGDNHYSPLSVSEEAEDDTDDIVKEAGAVAYARDGG